MIRVYCFKPLNSRIVCNAKIDKCYNLINPLTKRLVWHSGLPRFLGREALGLWCQVLGREAPTIPFLLQTSRFAPPSRIFLILAGLVVIARAALGPCLWFGLHSKPLGEMKHPQAK